MSATNVRPVPDDFATQAHIDAETYERMYRHSIEHPDEFWAMTPYEFQLLIGNTRTFAPLNRRRLTELVEKYPDQTEEGKND